MSHSIRCHAEPQAARVQTLTGTFRTHSQFHSQFLPHDRDVLIYLPPGYDSEPRRRYPVLYLHDGQNLFNGATSYIPGQEWRADETAQALITSGAIPPLIIVGIYNTGEHRLAEYTPTANEKQHGGEADRYGRMIVEELKPFIDSHYRTRKEAAQTGIGGSSLGGLVSLYLGLKYPKTFGKIAVVSPSIWWDSRFIVRFVQEQKSRPPLRVWLDMGTHEGKEPFASENIHDVRLLRDTLIRKGWRLDTDLKYLEVEGAEHNERAWAARFGDILRFLYR